MDTGAGVTFSVLRNGSNSTIHSGDLTSFKLNGVEFQAPYSSTARYSHFESGLSNANTATGFVGTQVIATVDPSPTPQWIKISCDDTVATAGTGATGVIQYYMARRNDPVIYMATYAPEMLVSSTRFITYLDWNKFPNHPDESDTSGGTGAIESQDVQGFADGTTASKYYGETRNIDHVEHHATGPSAGAYMFIGNRERGAGGPFWKDIDFQSTGAAVEIYNMPYSGHSLTDAFRPGLHGPYALVLTNGVAAPTIPNYSFIDGLGLAGWVSPSARGAITGKISGIAPGRVPTVGLSNAAAQFWATPDAAGNYTIPNVIPGTYTETLYDEELAVGTRTVTLAAGQTINANIANTYYLPPNPVFRIGTFDGTPREFLNGDKITIMHPQDTRMSPWTDMTFNVGTSPTNTLPMAIWKRDATQTGTSANVTLSFTLTAAQAAVANTLRIAITRAASGGRPIISVNGGSYSAAPTPSTQPDTRGITLGNWRGNNYLHTYGISTSALHAGTNTISIVVASGSSSTSAWLQPSVIFDAIDLVPTSSVNAPAIASIVVSPANPSVVTGAQQIFTAQAYSSTGAPLPSNLDWIATRGTIDAAGNYIAPASTGSDTVRATNGSVNGSTTVNVIAPLRVNTGNFDFETEQSLTFNFNRAVDPTMLSSALVLQNLTTSTTVPSSAIHLAYTGFTGTFTFDGILADGNYRVTIPTTAQLNSAGEHLPGTYNFDFYVLAGDADRNRTVDFSDLLILAQNYGQSGKTFSDGNFNYSADGLIDFSDLLLLAQRYGTSVLIVSSTGTGATNRPARSNRARNGLLA